MRARIYQPPKNAMQSGWAATRQWVLEFDPGRRPAWPDPLMGWIGGADTQSQVRLHFETREEAVAYAEKHGISYEIGAAAVAAVPARRPMRTISALAGGRTGRTERLAGPGTRP